VANGISNIGKIPELRRRLLFTVFMLAVFRIGAFITVPGVDRQVILDYMQTAQMGFLGLFNMFSGGALNNLSIMALGVMPYISASIIMQLLGVVVPAVERLQKEGDLGRKKITQYTRYGTVALCVVQALGLSFWLESLNAQAGTQNVVYATGFWFRLTTVMAMTTGSMFLMWMGEQITERGIGNGMSLIIFSGIVAGIPRAFVQTLSLSSFQGGKLEPITLMLIMAIVLVGVAVIVFFETSQRRIPVQYAKKVVGRKVYGGQSTFLPLKVNSAGVIPPIFASSVLMFPATIANLFPNSAVMNQVQNVLMPGGSLYILLYIALIVFFCFFYTAVTFNPIDVADNLKKYGGFIPGIRAGKKTAEYIDHVLSRITVGGAAYISAVCVLPIFMQTEFGVPFYFGGTSIMIVVGVALDTAQQIESYLLTRSYEGFSGSKIPRIRGRRATY
jgi:preprotein translocase subunit SecY